MEGNPYAALVQMFRQDVGEQFPVQFRIGKVQTENPLSVDVAGALQTRESLVFTTPDSTYEQGAELLLIPIEEEQRYIVLAQVYGL